MPRVHIDRLTVRLTQPETPARLEAAIARALAGRVAPHASAQAAPALAGRITTATTAASTRGRR